MDLDLAQVRAFVAVVDHRHFGRAAAELHVSQQALSKRVARLEAQLGRLIERRGMVLTPAGERFLPTARQLLALADAVTPLRVDVWSEIQTPARLVRAIADRTLTLELSMRRDVTLAIRALQRDELDVAFGYLPEVPAGLSAELVAHDEIGVMVRADQAAERFTAAELTDLWMPAASPELRAFSEDYARRYGITLHPAGSNLGLEPLVERVLREDILVPVVATWPVPDSVRIVPLDPAPRFPWSVIWRTDARHPQLAAFLAALRHA